MKKKLPKPRPAAKKKSPKNIRVIKPKPVAQEIKLDLGCGINKVAGYIGVDAMSFPGVDVVTDLREPWPWEDDSVTDVHCSHFFEHLTNPERIHFWNELHRVLKVGKQARVITPHWSHACAYGDPTHQWPGVSEWTVFYTNAAWRAVNAPHVPLTCDFDWQYTGSWDPWLNDRNQEFKMDNMQHNVNSFRDITFIVSKRDPAMSMAQAPVQPLANTGG